MLEKLEAHTKNESFVKRMQELAADPKFSAAATGYVEDMAQELTEGGGDVSGFGAELDLPPVACSLKVQSIPRGNPNDGVLPFRFIRCMVV